MAVTNPQALRTVSPTLIQTWNSTGRTNVWEEPGGCWILAVEWARLNSTDKPSNWQGHLHLQNYWYCSLQLLFHLISNTPDTCRATGTGDALQAGRRCSFLHFSFNLKGRCFKETRAFWDLLNIETSLGCSLYLPGLKLLLQLRWLGLQAASQPWGDHRASHVLSTCVQIQTQTLSLRAERNLKSHMSGPKSQGIQDGPTCYK